MEHSAGATPRAVLSGPYRAWQALWFNSDIHIIL